jgi:hypothetical protein
MDQRLVAWARAVNAPAIAALSLGDPDISG